MFFESIVKDDRPVPDLMTADYTFVNERLARHYGIPGVFGTDFRRAYRSSTKNRRGLLGKGAVLMVTSHANSTSPVLPRGKWSPGEHSGKFAGSAATPRRSGP